eukprot:scaffold471988_cov44-Prasinocladus_malaysianus.AAC.1
MVRFQTLKLHAASVSCILVRGPVTNRNNLKAQTGSMPQTNAVEDDKSGLARLLCSRFVALPSTSVGRGIRWHAGGSGVRSSRGGRVRCTSTLSTGTMGLHSRQ